MKLYRCKFCDYKHYGDDCPRCATESQLHANGELRARLAAAERELARTDVRLPSLELIGAARQVLMQGLTDATRERLGKAVMDADAQVSVRGGR
jgi:hypothetical protein